MLKLSESWSDERDMLLASSIARDLARMQIVSANGNSGLGKR